MTSKKLREKTKMFQETILLFYKQQGRELPWRRTTDPYKILVSELMLQQTQVDRVIPKYEAFLEAFPSPRALHDAPLADVLALWQGLGYNRRAKYLWQAASLFLRFPKPSFEQLVDLKGVGEYTAAAVCAFAYNKDVAAVDVNVRRVFNRFFGAVNDEFIAKRVPFGRSRDWHNALMDFGSLVCTKRNPSCATCRLSESCHAFQNNTFADEPTRSQKTFLGSVRWHRGQLLKAVLKSPVSFEKYWSSLNRDHRNHEFASIAAKQLVSEGLVLLNGSLFCAPLQSESTSVHSKSRHQHQS